MAHSDAEFIERAATLLRDAARVQASAESWDTVFEQVYDGYEVAQHKAELQRPLL